MQLAPTQRRKTLLATFTGSASKASTASCLCCLHYACASASTTWLPPAAELSSNNADEPPQCSVVSEGGRCTDGQSPSNHQSDGSGFQGQPLCCCLNAKTAAVTFRHSWVDICAAASSSASPNLGWWGGGAWEGATHQDQDTLSAVRQVQSQCGGSKLHWRDYLLRKKKSAALHSGMTSEQLPGHQCHKALPARAKPHGGDSTHTTCQDQWCCMLGVDLRT